MNKRLVGGILGALIFAGVAAFLAYAAGRDAGRSKGRDEGRYYSRQTPVDAGSVNAIGTQIHFGAAHVQHDLGDEILAKEVATLLKQGGGLVELHDPRFGLSNAIHDPFRLTTLVRPGWDFAILGVTSISATTVEGRPRVTISGATGPPVELDFTDASQVSEFQQKLNELFFKTPRSSSLVRLDLIVTTGQPPAAPDRWALFTLTLLQNSTGTDTCADHIPDSTVPATALPAP